MLAGGKQKLCARVAGHQRNSTRDRALRRSILLLALVAIATNFACASIGLDANVSKDATIASTTIVSPAFSTVSPNELLLAFVATDYLSGTNTTVKSVAGGGLTWTLVVRANAQSGSSEIWRAFAATPLSATTMTATLSQSVVSSLTVISFTGVNTSGLNGLGAIGATASKSAGSSAPTASLVTTASNSLVIGVGNDYDNGIARTVGSGQTLVHQNLTSSGDTYWVQMLANVVPLSGTSVAINDTAPTKDRFNLAIVEVIAALSGGQSWSISGTLSPTTGGAGATVTLSGASSATAVADSNGNYTFTGLANGSYAVTPSKSGFTFTPASQPVTLNGANQTGINFTAQAVVSTWNITGTISGAGGSGATLNLTGAASASVIADASGNYTFPGLANGSYTVTPSKSGFTFSPVNRTVTVSGANQAGVNFSTVSQTYLISGTVSPIAGGGGATVTLSGAISASTTADANGNYTFASLANGTYLVTPSNAGYSFTPASQSVTLSGANKTGVNFTAQAVVANQIQLIQTNVSGNESTSSSISASFKTNNTAGNFIVVSGTIARPSGTLVVSDTRGNTYIPVTNPVTDVVQNVTSCVWYVPSCKGGANTVTLTPPVAGALEIHVSEWTGLASTNPVEAFTSATGSGTNASSGTITTTTSGDLIYGYTFLLNTAVAGSGFTGMTLVNGDLDEYQIQSTLGAIAATYTQSSGTWFSSVVAFRPGNVTQGTISGTITPVAGGSGATVTLSGAANATVIADASGNYSFAGLASGTYTVTPSNAGFTFSPTNSTVILSGSNQTGINFTAQPTNTSWSITGSITPAASGSGATVTLGGAATATSIADANGNYTFAGLASGTYSVTPVKSGYTFTPSNQSVNVNAANVSGINFTAVAPSNSIALDVNTSRDSAASATISSSSFSTSSPNELILAFISADYLSGANTTVKSISGGGLTWTLVVRANGQSGSSEIWRAFAASSVSNITVTASLSQSVFSSMTVMSFSGVSTAGTNGSGAIGATASQSAASGAPAASLVSTGSNSWVLGVGNDYDNAITRTVGSGQGLVHQDLTANGDTYWVQRQINPIAAPGTVVAINDTAPTKDRFNLAIVEILAGGGGSNSTPPSVSMTSPAQGGLVSSLVTVSAIASDNIAVTGVQFLLDGASLGSEITTPPYAFTWNSTTVSDGPHTLAARARDSVGLVTTSTAVAITVSNSSNSAVVSSWSSVVNLPAVAVNLVLLQNNKVLFYQDGATPTVWDYVAGTFNNIPAPADLFCSGHALLSDGRVLVVGGYGESATTIGINNAEIFDPSNQTWRAVPNMKYRRWYPSATTLSDGRILVTAGWQSSAHTNAGISEIYDPASSSWTQLTNANNPFETYPFMYLLPDGRVIHIGGSEYPTDTDVLDLSTTTWSVVDPNIVDGGSATMYLPGKFMKAGSAADSQTVGASSNTTFVLDMTDPSPAWRQTASMAYARSFLNLTTLPDGSVLATGGETDKDGGKIANAVYAAELWSPGTQTWSTMASMHTPREYHGTALLLPDGRVLESGMGADFGNVPDEKSAEFYSPAYLFKGPRPSISQAPTQIGYGANFFVGTPDGANVASVSLIRTGAVTHFFDQNSRYIPLSFTQTSGGLTVTSPINSNLAPPGYYMLFLVNGAGVPSIAPFVQVQ